MSLQYTRVNTLFYTRGEYRRVVSKPKFEKTIVNIDDCFSCCRLLRINTGGKLSIVDRILKGVSFVYDVKYIL